MKKNILLVALIALLISFNLIIKAQTIEVSGIVSGIWDIDTVKVVDNIQVREVETLLIFPGVHVIFQGEYFLDIQGCVKASGSEMNPIIFTIADTTGFHNDTLPDGGWKNIRLENINPSVDSTIFSFCHFEYGKAVSSDSIYGYGGALCIRNSIKISIENCTFQSNYAYYNGGAVYLKNSSIRVYNNTFNSNRCGQTFAYYGYGGGLCTDGGKPNIYYNTFEENTSTGIGGGLCVRFADCMVTHNIFKNNFSALGGGFGILHIPVCNFVISNNLFIQNGAEFFGAAISNGDCSPTYVNNTITDNHCFGGGGGFYCKDSVVPVLHNNIIYGNTQFGGEVNQVYLWDLLSQPNFYYNNIEGGKENFYGTGGTGFFGEYENNIDENPLFVSGEFSILPESPCVNVGNPDTTNLFVPEIDIAGQARIAHERIDIGAYENQEPLIIMPARMGSSFHITISPNPSKHKLKFTFELVESAAVEINLKSLNGKRVFQIYNGHTNTGNHSIEWNFESLALPNEIYIASIEIGNESFSKKVIILK